MKFECPACGAPLDKSEGVRVYYMCGTQAIKGKGLTAHTFSADCHWRRQKQYAKNQCELGSAR